MQEVIFLCLKYLPQGAKRKSSNGAISNSYNLFKLSGINHDLVFFALTLPGRLADPTVLPPKLPTLWK